MAYADVIRPHRDRSNINHERNIIEHGNISDDHHKALFRPDEICTRLTLPGLILLFLVFNKNFRKIILVGMDILYPEPVYPAFSYILSVFKIFIPFSSSFQVIRFLLMLEMFPIV